MRIRTQLILAALVLAVIPLGAIVTWSHHSSRKALKNAYRNECDRMTRQMDRRLATIRAELDQRMNFVSALPVTEGNTAADVGNIVTVMGETASLVDALEFQPVRTAEAPSQPQTAASSNASAPVETQTPAAPGIAPAPAPRPAASRAPQIARTMPAAGAPEVRGPEAERVPAELVTVHLDHISSEVSAATKAAALEDLAALESLGSLKELRRFGEVGPIVIDLPNVVSHAAFVISEEQRELIGEITALSRALSTADLPQDEREDLRRELKDAQRRLQMVVQRDTALMHKRSQEVAARQREVHARNAMPAGARVKVAVKPTRPPAAGTVATSPVPPAPQPPAVEETPAVPAVPAATLRPSTENDVAVSAEKAKKTSLLLGRTFEAPLRQEGEVVGQLTARVSPNEVVRRILGEGQEEGNEIPFAIDREGSVYTRTTLEREKLESLGIVDRLTRGRSLNDLAGWIVSTSVDSESGLRIGVARPVGENLSELRKTAGQNFAFGLGLIAFALIGIVPLSNHLTRDVKRVTDGADRIAHGDLMTRLPVKTNNELGQLARAFNRMAADLSLQQEKLVEQERARKEQEMQQRLLAVEYERKTAELEEARRFQLSMLPKIVPLHEDYDLAVYTQTATEVGGDYYDFHLAGDTLSVTIGDATGHGAKAGTMVTVVKTLFAGYDATVSPSLFLEDAAERIKRMDLGRMAMALTLARIERHRVTFAAAGMPPLLLHRGASGEVEEFALAATPLGTIGVSYPERTIDLESGDTLLFLTDGFPELMNMEGQQIGYPGVLETFRQAAGAGESAGEVIAEMARATRRWHGDLPPNDDVTFVVLRVA